MRFEELNWMDVDEYLKHDDRLMLVLGACEQHGYLSLLSDVKIPLALADAASQQTSILVAPPLNFGCSPYFLAYPGTFSLRAATLNAAVEDLIRSAKRQGFRRILILNGHGGNSPARAQLREVINDIPELKLAWYEWWLSKSIERIAQKHDLQLNHANWLEAFAFTIVADLPEAEKKPPHVPADILDADTTRQVYGDGSFGGHYRVEESIMQEIFEAALQDVLHLLRFE